MSETFSSDLANRLLRRATRPVGVIDVRPSQERYERAAAWPRQHVTMLDRAAARQQTEPQPCHDQRLLFAARSLEAAAPPRDMMPGDPLMDALRSSPAALSPASLARIAARQRSGSSEPAVGASAAAPAAPREDGPSRSVSRGETIIGPAMRAVTRSSADLPLTARGGTRHADRDGHSEPSSVRRGGDDAPPMNTSNTSNTSRGVAPAESTSIAATEPVAASTAARASAVRANEAARVTIDAPYVFVQRRQPSPHERTSPPAASAPKTGTAPSIASEIAAPPAHTASDLSLARSHRSTTADDTAVFDPNVVAVRPGAAYASPATALAVAERVVAPPLTADREPSLSLRVARSVPSVRQPVSAQPSQAGNAPAIPVAAAERGATDAAPLQLVWRRASTPDTVMAAAAGNTTSAHNAGGAAAAAAATAWTSPLTAGAADPAAASSAGAGRESGGGMELEQIVEEVMRRIDEMMRIERERRGDPWL